MTVDCGLEEVKTVRVGEASSQESVTQSSSFWEEALKGSYHGCDG